LRCDTLKHSVSSGNFFLLETKADWTAPPYCTPDSGMAQKEMPEEPLRHGPFAQDIFGGIGEGNALAPGGLVNFSPQNERFDHPLADIAPVSGPATFLKFLDELHQPCFLFACESLRVSRGTENIKRDKLAATNNTPSR
jgi:hypothetical protein